MRRYKANQFIKILEKAKHPEEFDMDLYFMFTEKMIVLEEKKIIVSLLDGTEIECEIR